MSVYLSVCHIHEEQLTDQAIATTYVSVNGTWKANIVPIIKVAGTVDKMDIATLLDFIGYKIPTSDICTICAVKG